MGPGGKQGLSRPEEAEDGPGAAKHRAPSRDFNPEGARQGARPCVEMICRAGGRDEGVAGPAWWASQTPCGNLAYIPPAA